MADCVNSVVEMGVSIKLNDLKEIETFFRNYIYDKKTELVKPDKIWPCNHNKETDPSNFCSTCGSARKETVSEVRYYLKNNVTVNNAHDWSSKGLLIESEPLICNNYNFEWNSADVKIKYDGIDLVWGYSIMTAYNNRVDTFDNSEIQSFLLFAEKIKKMINGAEPFIRHTVKISD